MQNRLKHLNAVIDHIIMKQSQLSREIKLRGGRAAVCEKAFIKDCVKNIEKLRAQRRAIEDKL